MPPLDQQHDILEKTREKIMSFGDHLEELRMRLLLGLAAPLPLAIVLFFFANDIRNFMCRPLFSALRSAGLPAQLQALSPAETLATDLKLSIIAALVISAPWLLWQIWLFISPGLYVHERRFARFFVPGSALLVLMGLALLYYVMLPLMLRVLIGFGIAGTHTVIEVPTDAVSEQAEVSTIPILQEHPEHPVPGQVWIKLPEHLLSIAVRASSDPEDNSVEILNAPLTPTGMVGQTYRLKEYVNFVLILMVGISIAFQMPLVILLIGWLGIVDIRFLRRNRKYALLICAVVAAIITPADVASMILMFIPLYVLYEAGILLLVFAPARKIADGTVMRGIIGGIDERDDRSQDPPAGPSGTVTHDPDGDTDQDERS